MSDLREELEDLLDEKPGVADDLRDILAVDAEAGSWTFDDVPLDSGTFGEIVSRGLVTETDDGGYEVTDREAMAAVLDRDSDAGTTGATTDGAAVYDGVVASLAGLSVPDRREAGALVGVLSLLAVFRLFPYGSVFRNGDVVFSANDPYFYRYHVGEMLARANGPLDVAALSNVPAANGEPLLVVVLWWVTELLGGDPGTADLVLAWYPVVTAVASGLCLYVLAVRLTDDVRVGLATVGLLAVMPIHAIRTGLGFADHHPFDLLLLSLTATLLVFLGGRELRDPATWVLALALGGTVGAQTLAWDAGPLLLAPIGAYVAVRVVADLQNGVRPGVEHAPLLAGLGTSAVLVYIVHSVYGWHADVVAVAPALLFVGAFGVVSVAEVVHRIDGSPTTLVGAELGGAVVGGLLLSILVPTMSDALGRGVAFLVQTGGINETRPLFAGSLGGIIAPFFHFGFLLLLAFPYMIWFGWWAYREGDHEWFVVLAYAWGFFALSLLQIRFASELSLFAAVFAGTGFVHLASWVDLVEPPAMLRDSSTPSNADQVASPGRRTTLRLAGLSLGIGGLGALLTPIEHQQVVADDVEYRTLSFMRAYSERHSWEYPDNYVFSQWSRNRMYNYFVNGQSRSYQYAKQNYPEFLSDTDVSKWYEILRDRAGFVLTTDGIGLGEESIYSYLHEYHGDRRAAIDSVGRFRMLYESSDGSRKIFTPVAGALIAGQAPDDGSGIVETSVTLDESSFGYERQVDPAENGWYAVRVPYPGDYNLPDGGSASVSETDVVTAAFTNERTGTADWTLSAGRGEHVFDTTGGNHGTLSGGEWQSREAWSGIRFDGDGFATVPAAPTIDGRDGFTLSVRFRTSEDADYTNSLPFPRLVSKAPTSAYGRTDGYQIALSGGQILGAVGNGSAATTVRGNTVSNGRWYDVTLSWDGTTARLYVDDELVDTGTFDGTPGADAPLVFGASGDESKRFVGSISRVSFRDRAVDPADLDRSGV